jgi:N-acetylglucosaminyl-diphospho-decaprenol L-rhamnosyltransferase
MPDLSIVVVSWNSGESLAALLPSVAEHLRGAHEVIVVDNASADDSVAVAKAWPDLVRTVSFPENRGFGAAANAGVREARHEAAILLNPDSRLVDSSLEALADLALELGALCGPELLEADGSRQPSASAPPGGWQVGLEALLPAALLPRALRLRCEPWRAPRRIEAGWLTGACIAAPRELLLRLGPFDERIHLYGEDLDLGVRAGRLGIPSIFAPDVARIVHLGGRSAALRFPDGGAAASLAARRIVTRRLLGGRRERYDHAATVVFHATRYLAKRALRRDGARERAWLEAAVRARRA